MDSFPCTFRSFIRGLIVRAWMEQHAVCLICFFSSCCILWIPFCSQRQAHLPRRPNSTSGAPQFCKVTGIYVFIWIFISFLSNMTFTTVIFTIFFTTSNCILTRYIIIEVTSLLYKPCHWKKYIMWWSFSHNMHGFHMLWDNGFMKPSHEIPSLIIDILLLAQSIICHYLNIYEK